MFSISVAMRQFAIVSKFIVWNRTRPLLSCSLIMSHSCHVRDDVTTSFWFLITVHIKMWVIITAGKLKLLQKLWMCQVHGSEGVCFALAAQVPILLHLGAAESESHLFWIRYPSVQPPARRQLRRLLCQRLRGQRDMSAGSEPAGLPPAGHQGQGVCCSVGHCTPAVESI